MVTSLETNGLEPQEAGTGCRSPQFQSQLSTCVTANVRKYSLPIKYKYTCFDNGRAKFKSQLHHYNLWKVGKVEMLRMLPDIYWMLNKPLL